MGTITKNSGKLRPGEVRGRVGGEQGGRRCVPLLTFFHTPSRLGALQEERGKLDKERKQSKRLGQCFASGVRWERG